VKLSKQFVDIRAYSTHVGFHIFDSVLDVLRIPAVGLKGVSPTAKVVKHRPQSLLSRRKPSKVGLDLILHFHDSRSARDGSAAHNVGGNLGDWYHANLSDALGSGYFQTDDSSGADDDHTVTNLISPVQIGREEKSEGEEKGRRTGDAALFQGGEVWYAL
jgi:hypothetical protein